MISVALALAMPMVKLQIPNPTEFAKPLVQLLEAEWPKNRVVTIVCHGHSVPAGYFKTPVVQSFDAYPHLLHVALKERFPLAVINVIVTAIGGEESGSGAKRFESDVLALKPDVVTIDYSLNDRGLGLERARAAWVSMILAAQAKGVKVVLLTPSWDQIGNVSLPTDPLQLHAQQVRELAKLYKTGLADAFQAFLDYKSSGGKMPQVMSQSNHPNRAGHELILAKLRPWFGLESP